MPAPTTAPHRLLVISDLHLTTGLDPVTGQWSPTEDFFWDADFAEFLAYYTDGNPTTLIINGDLVDFLQVLSIPNPEERVAFDISPDELHPKYGLRDTEHAAEFLMVKVLNGHARFFEALALFVGRGNELVIIKGNHDVQFFWPGVQRRLVDRLQQLCVRNRLAFDPSRVRFAPWCYCIPGLIFVEHGNQYEGTTAFRNFLMPILPYDLPNGRRELELDLSGVLVRFMTNRVEPVNPLADNVRPFSGIYRLLWKEHPWVILGTFTSAMRALFRAGRKRQLWRVSSIRQRYVEIRRLNDLERDEEARRCAPHDPVAAARLVELFSVITGRLHRRPTLERSIWRFLKGRRQMMPNVSRLLRHSAQALAGVLETGFIIFGHAHYPDALLLGNGTRYFNSGSWIPTLLEPAPGYPNAWQFTFFLLEDGTGTLLRWVPESHQPEPFTVQ